MSLEKVPQHIKDLALQIKTGLTFDDEGVGVVADDTFEKHLPEGLDLATVKKVQTTVLDFADATTLAVGEAGLETLGAKKDLASVSLRIKAGHDHINTEMQRTVARRNPSTGESFNKHGVVSTKLSSGIGAGRGNYKKIAEDLSERAASVFNQ